MTTYCTDALRNFRENVMEKYLYHKDLIESLKDPEYAADYLKETLVASKESNDSKEFELIVFLSALRNIAEAYEIIPPRG